MNFQPMKAIRTLFGYNAVVDKKRRASPRSVTQSEDKVLNTSDRKKLVATLRDQRRNLGLLAWMCRKHLDYVANFTFKPITGNQDLDKDLSRLFKWWSRKENCDIAGRHSLQRFVRLAEAHKIVDGDVGILKVQSGHLQAIEGDRITTPTLGQLPSSVKGKKIDHGVVINGQLRALSYIINSRRDRGSMLVFERIVQARDMILYGCLDRFDQTRGISPLSSIVNMNQDVHESFEYQNLKIKFHAMFGIAIKRKITDDSDGFEYTDADDGLVPDKLTSKYDFKIQPGLKLEMDQGDDIDVIESKTPSQEFIDYANLMIQNIILALDFPMTFFDSRRSSYSSARQDTLNYNQGVQIKRQSIRDDILDPLTKWKIEHWTRATDPETNVPMLVLPNGMLPRDVKWEWRAVGLPWIDPLKEVSADARAIAIGVKSRQQVSNERGLDWEQTVSELEFEEQELIKRSVTVEIGTPGSQTTRDEEGANSANADDNSGDNKGKGDDGDE